MEKTARAVIISNGKLLVFFRRRVRDGIEVKYYAIPGGHVEGNETLEDTVVRELKEEMNLDISILGYLGKIVIDDKEEYYYYAKIVGGQLQFGGEELDRCNENNYYEIRWLPITELDTSGIRAVDLIKRADRFKYGD